MNSQLVEKIKRNSIQEIDQFFNVFQTWTELNSDGVKIGNALVECISKLYTLIKEDRQILNSINSESDQIIKLEHIYNLLVNNWRQVIDKLIYQYEKMLNIRSKLENYQEQLIIDKNQSTADTEPILMTWTITHLVDQYNNLLNFFDQDLCLKFEICNFFIEKNLSSNEDSLKLSCNLSAWLHKPSLNSPEFQNIISYLKIEAAL